MFTRLDENFLKDVLDIGQHKFLRMPVDLRHKVCLKKKNAC